MLPWRFNQRFWLQSSRSRWSLWELGPPCSPSRRLVSFGGWRRPLLPQAVQGDWEGMGDTFPTSEMPPFHLPLTRGRFGLQSGAAVPSGGHRLQQLLPQQVRVCWKQLWEALACSGSLLGKDADAPVEPCVTKRVCLFIAHSVTSHLSMTSAAPATSLGLSPINGED